MKILLLIICTLQSFIGYSQTNHWETVVYGNDIGKYHIGNTDPGNNWFNTSFNDASWPSGKGGFGYGDGDDSTNTGATVSVFSRTHFNIVDTSKISRAILHVDYDDGFVAYLNGVEIARSNIGSISTPPLYNDFANSNHEAVLYTGGTPEDFLIDKSVLNSLLVDGDNVLAIEAHNVTNTSSDLSSITYLTLGITDATTNYGTPPFWFFPPKEFYSSNLPIININSFNQPIVDDPKVLADFGIIYNGSGQINYKTDAPNEYSGDIMIEIRGESSQSFNKKSYAFETVDASGLDMDTSFLNFPSEEDWILYGPYSDKTFLRNVLAMKIGREMGSYNSRTRMVEVIVNGNYEGVYVMMEKIKKDKNRLDISKLAPIDIDSSQLTGGYIFRIDKGIYDGWYSNYDVPANPGNKMYYQYVYPDQDIIQPEQKDYIENYVDDFENALANQSFYNNDGKRYNEYIHFNSFFDFFLINEISNNVDGFRLSSYFHKNRDTKDGLLHAGPFWDFNLSFGNGDYCEGWKTNVWQYEECGQYGPFWWERFIEDTMYTRGLKCRWEELRQTTLETSYLMDYIDSMQTTLDSASLRNYDLHPILGTYVWPNPFPYYATYDEEVDDMQDWLTARLIWLDNNIPGIASNCDDFLNEGPNNIAKLKISHLDIYPNPASTQTIVYLKSEGKSQHIEIYNAIGRFIMETESFLGSTFTLNVSELENGLYVIKTYSDNRVIGISKMIVNK